MRPKRPVETDHRQKSIHEIVDKWLKFLNT